MSSCFQHSQGNPGFLPLDYPYEICALCTMHIRNPTSWKRRSSFGRGLTVITVFGVLLGIGLAGGTDSREACHDVCLTPGCVRAASTVLNKIDTNVQPCDNFYRFACGKFLKSTPIPDDKVSWDQFDIVSEKVKKQLRASIEAPVEPDERKPFRLVKNLFKSCMNKTAIEAEGFEPLHKMLKKIGGWPVIDGEAWNEDDFHWINSIYKLYDVGYSTAYFMSFGVGPHLMNSTRRSIYLDQPTLAFFREYLIRGRNDKDVAAYYDLIVDIAVLLGADRERASIEIEESVQFEIQLANMSVPWEKRRDISKLYNPMNLTELTKNYPSIPWREYFRKFLPDTVTVEDDEVAIVLMPGFISDLEALISATPKRVLANYVLWRVVVSSIPWLNDVLRERVRKFVGSIMGESERKPRATECLNYVTGNLGLGVSAIYVRNYFDKEAKTNVMHLVKDVKQQFSRLLEQAEWMDEETRRLALEKAAAIVTHIGYPDELTDDNKIDEVYKNLELSGGNYMESRLNMSNFDRDDALSKLHEPVTKGDWTRYGHVTYTSPGYDLFDNHIQIPAGSLQDVFFSHDRPRYMNYGAIGSITAHEIIHGFDNLGRQFDKDGNLADWWAPLTGEHYLERAQCIIDQYGNYTVEEVGLNLNGNNGLGESIADNGGTKAAYLAYINWVEANAPEQKLPGLPYSPKQMFWISTANTLCEKYKPESLAVEITTGAHIPGEFRVIGTLSNIPEFSKDFNCPIGSNMNPEKKCTVW